MKARSGGWCAVLLLFGMASHLAAQGEASEADREAIVGVALDYIEGFHEGDTERMARAVHADMAKRIARPGRDGVRRLSHMGKWTLVEMTGRNRNALDTADFSDRVRILDVYEGAAMVRVDADTWVDFLQVAKFGDGWQIVNVLWELRPRTGGTP